MNREVLSLGAFPSLPRRGGRAIKNMVPFRKGADGVVAHKLCFGMRFETCLVVDHPVCGATVASRLFIDAAATPPLQGGESDCPERFIICYTPLAAGLTDSADPVWFWYTQDMGRTS